MWLCSRLRGKRGAEGSRRKERGDSRTSWRFCAQSYSETFEHLFHESAYYVRRRGCRAKRLPGGVQRDECPRLSKYMHQPGRDLVCFAVVQKGVARDDRLCDSSHVRRRAAARIPLSAIPLICSSMIISYLILFPRCPT